MASSRRQGWVREAVGKYVLCVLDSASARRITTPTGRLLITFCSLLICMFVFILGVKIMFPTSKKRRVET